VPDTSTPLSVDHVRFALEPYGLEVILLPEDSSTAVLAAEALDTSVDRIVKSLLFFADDEPVLALVAGDRKVDRRLLARELGARKVRFATPEQVIVVGGYAIGGVPPVGHRSRLRTVMDRALLGHDVVYAAAGASNAVFGVPPAELRSMTDASLTDATE
jgi:Cys-tRNA(Pro) deacylase